jgi:serine/threonine-protein kinase
MAGETLGGRYELRREIGVRHAVRIYHALDTQTDKAVIVKAIQVTEQNVDALVRFQAEGAILLNLRHPNICEIYGTFIENGICCIALESVEGRSLREILGAKRLDLQRIATMVRQVASALAYAHSRGVIHRDINPDNVVVMSGDRVKLRALSELGIARLVRTGATLSTMAGLDFSSVSYAAPEQIAGELVDHRSDIYSLGAVMYEMVTGRPPFEEQHPAHVAAQHVGASLVLPSRVRADLPAGWDDVILKMLAENPIARFQTAAVVEEAIVALQGSETSSFQLMDARRCPRCGREGRSNFCTTCGTKLASG